MASQRLIPSGYSPSRSRWRKLHACTAPDTDGWTNDRAHDLIDLQLIHQDLGSDSRQDVRIACERLFRARQGHPWPAEVSARDEWPARYRQEREHVDADIIDDLGTAIRWANDLIGQIAEA